jgi:hypothetical protein
MSLHSLDMPSSPINPFLTPELRPTSQVVVETPPLTPSDGAACDTSLCPLWLQVEVPAVVARALECLEAARRDFAQEHLIDLGVGPSRVLRNEKVDDHAAGEAEDEKHPGCAGEHLHMGEI